MSKARLWIQEMIDHPEWGRTENKWDAINEIGKLLDGRSLEHSKRLEDKLLTMKLQIKLLTEDGELKCDEIAKLKKDLNKACELLDKYNQAFRNLCENHPRVEKEQWRKVIGKIDE